ncbi:hypothetical protein [Streptomyces sp. NBC_00624]|uniref:hypothetical protein n=1 Tax=Streptomyces sp. NBC_00624 TaxID=2975791 RepID=UPI0030E10C11
MLGERLVGPERATRRAQQPAAIDPDWNPGQLVWTIDWQRRYTRLRVLLEGGASLEEIAPDVTHRGDDIGRWTAREARDWALLHSEQLGQGKAPTPSHGAKQPSRSTSDANGRPSSEGSTSKNSPTATSDAWASSSATK